MSKVREADLYPKGAEWRKWDLHIHSDASDGRMSPEEIVKTAKEKKISVLALTDHHTAKNIDRLRNIGKHECISVIAGIEFRTEYGSKSVHLIGLFPEYFGEYHLDGSNLQSLVLDSLDLSEARILAAGRKKLSEDGKNKITDADAWKTGLFCVQVDFRKASSKIHEYGGIVIPHSGSKENSLDREMKHEGKLGVGLFESLGPVKQELFEEKYIDICEIRKKGDNETFYLEHFNRASIVSSDAHRIEEVGQSFTWIKADPVFAGLLQLIQEPAARVYIGEQPDLLKRIALSPTKYMKSLLLSAVPGDNCKNGKWFENVQIQLNPELVAIIGNKGSGKSAIADILGLCTDCRKESNFSFLNPARFRQKGYADKFYAQIGWESGESSAKKLMMEHVDGNNPEASKYLPQGYFENLCNETTGLQELKKEINEVVYRHVPEELRLDQPSFEMFLDHKNAAMSDAISACKKRLFRQNQELIALERKTNPKYIEGVRKSLAQKEAELRTLKPIPVVRKPATKGKRKRSNDPDRGQMDELEATILELDNKIRKARSERGKINKVIDAVASFIREALRIEKEVKDLIQKGRATLKSVQELKIEEIISFRFNKASLDTFLAAQKARMKELDVILSEKSMPDKDKNERSLLVLHGSAEKREKVLQEKLDEPGLQYAQYLTEKKIWNTAKAKIVGNSKTDGTLKYYKAHLDYLKKNLKTDIVKARKQREEIVREIHQYKEETIALYADIKEYVSKILKEHSNEIPDYPITIVAELFVKDTFVSDALAFVNKAVSGTFKGIIDGSKHLQSICDKYDLNDENGMIQVLAEIFAGLENEKRTEGAIMRYIDDQIEDLDGFYAYLFGLD